MIGMISGVGVDLDGEVRRGGKGGERFGGGDGVGLDGDMWGFVGVCLG